MAWNYHGGGAPAGSENPVVDGNLAVTGNITAAQVGWTWYAHTFATGGDGTVGSPWTGWEAALNALPENSDILFPAGSYSQTVLVDVKVGWKIFGAGRRTTTITTAMIGTAFRLGTAVASPIGLVSIRHLSLACTNVANTGSGILAVSCGAADLSDVEITGFRFSLTQINAEVFRCDGVVFNFPTQACVWIVNSGDYNLTYADIDYSSYAGGDANAISFYGCQFNGASSPAPILVIDDGGYNHAWYSCNFNSGTSAFRFAGVSMAIVVSADFEGQTDDIALSSTATYHAAAGVGPNLEVTFQASMLTPFPGKACFDATVFESLILVGNRFNTAGAVIKNANGCNLVNVRSFCNNGPLYDVTPSSYFDLISNNNAKALATSLPILTTGAFTLPAQAMTAGTMTASTSAAVRSVLHRFDWTNAMVVALGASTTGDITVCSLPAGAVVKNVYVVIDTPDTSANALTVAVGRVAAGYIDYIVASDAKAAANTVYGDASAERGTNLTGSDLPSVTGATAVKAHFIKTATNLSTVLGSTGHIYIETMVLP